MLLLLTRSTRAHRAGAPLLVALAWLTSGTTAAGNQSSGLTDGPRFLLAAKPDHQDKTAADDRFRRAAKLLEWRDLPSPTEAALIADAADGRLDRHDLFEAALIASGVSDAETAEDYREQYRRWASDVRHLQKLHAKPRPLAEAIYDYLHRSVLTGGYERRATDLTHVFSHGRYNCVSATVLYNCLAAECGLEASAAETPGHAFSLLRIDGAVVEIQTTCPTWFGLVNRPREQAAQLERVTGQAGAATGARRSLSEPQLLATIYYNRGVDLLERKEYAAAVTANLRALELDSTSETARDNLLAAFNNWALDECTAKNFASACELLDRAAQLAPDHSPFRANRLHVYRMWSEHLLAAGRLTAALDLLDNACQRWPNEPYLDAKRFDLVNRGAIALLHEQTPRSSIDAGLTAALDVVSLAAARYPGRAEIGKARAAVVAAAAAARSAASVSADTLKQPDGRG